MLVAIDQFHYFVNKQQGYCFFSFFVQYSPFIIMKSSFLLLISDWGPEIDVVGFCFLDLASRYEPPESLVKWIEAGEKPIYIGFGSLVSFFLFFEGPLSSISS